jgi:alkylhydroperoxidase family enzyme
MRAMVLPFVLSLLVSVGCAASRSERGLEAARGRTSHFPLLPEDEARAAMPGFRGRAVPNLARVAALMPETWKAEMAAWGALQREGTLPPDLLGEVFYVVSDRNDCFY